MKRFTQWGNDLYTGETSIGFVRRRNTWFIIGIVLICLSVASPFLRGGFNFGIEFTGGSEFQVSAPTTQDQALATEDAAAYSETPARVQLLGDGSIRVQTDTLTQEENNALRADLAESYGTTVEHVAVSTIGPSWGADITRQMVIGIIVFLVLAAALMSFYFRTWKMAVAAILALVHDLIVTAGVYALTGVEITPAAVIGFLTILGYSLYDTVVVFDKVRENTKNYGPGSARTFAESVNLAINQTLVRSINTSVVALLPVMAILFIGAFVMGAGTLRDISLALFIGILVGALSTIFLAGPLYSALRAREPKIRETDAEIRRRRDAGIEPDAEPEHEDDDADGEPARPERENDGAQV